jgi:Protein of unknown function (DUF732)
LKIPKNTCRNLTASATTTDTGQGFKPRPGHRQGSAQPQHELETTMKKMIIGGLAAAAAAIGIAAAAPAVATGYGSSPDVNGYLSALEHDGIPYTSSSVQVGTEVCTMLRQSVGVQPLIDDITTGTDVPRQFVTAVVVDAHMYLCADAPFVSTGYVSGGWSS